MKPLALLAAALLALAIFADARAQDEGGGRDDGFLVNLLEDRLSGPGRTISVSGISGALSSEGSIETITVADEGGVWLRIEGVVLNWSRTALLRRRLDINNLEASRIVMRRRPEAKEQPRNIEARETPFTLPELPLAVEIDNLAIGEVVFEEPAFGEAARLDLAGQMTLKDGALDAALDIDRLDEPGGTFALETAFSNETRILKLDLRLEEPSGGLISKRLAIEGDPPVTLALEGEGPLDEMDITFRFDAGQTRVAEGLAEFRAAEDGQGFDVDLRGDLAPLVPAQFREFFAGTSQVRVAGVSKAEGGLRLGTIDVTGAALDLKGSYEGGPDGFPQSLDLAGTLGDPTGEAITLPVPGGQTTIHSATLFVDYGDGNRWDGYILLDRLRTSGFLFEDTTLKLGGLAQNLESPAQRNVTINVEGIATGVHARDPKVAAAIGPRLDFFADLALPAQSPLEVNQLQLTGNGLSLFTSGTWSDFVYDGRTSLRAGDIAVFSELAGRELAGRLALRTEGTLAPLRGAFDLTFDGESQDLGLAIPRLDPLLTSATTLSGRLVRDASGIRTEDLRLENEDFSFASTGIVSGDETDIGFTAALSDLAALEPRASGRLEIEGTAQGRGTPFDVALTARLPRGQLIGRTVTGLEFGFTGTASGERVIGALSGTGALDGLTLGLGGALTADATRQSLQDLAFTLGPTRIAGNLARMPGSPLEGALTVLSPDIAPLAALALQDAEGAVTADVTLSDAGGTQRIDLTASIEALRAAGIEAGALQANLSVLDALGVPLADGTISGDGVTVAGIDVRTLRAEARTSEAGTMDFDAGASLAIGTEIETAGTLTRIPGGLEATLRRLRLAQASRAATLTAPATIRSENGAITLTPLDLDLGAGRLSAAGTAGDTLDIALDLQSVPLDLANTIRPDLGAAGTVTGTARVSGPRGAPNVSFDLDGRDIAASVLRRAGLPALSVTATGQSAGKSLELDAALTGANGLAADVRGDVPLGEGALDLDIGLDAFPLAMFDTFAKRDLRGDVTGTGRVTGPLRSPVVAFDLTGSGISERFLQSNDLPPVDATARGRYTERVLTLDAATITNRLGLDLSGGGTLPFGASGLDIEVSGAVPLAMAGPVLAKRGATAAGTATVDLSATGRLADPALNGAVALSGATLVDPQTNLRLDDVRVQARLAGRSVTITELSASPAAGGRVTGGGTVALDAASGYPADLFVEFGDVRYTDGAFVTLRFGGRLDLDGPILGTGGALSGRILLEEAEISISEGLGANAGAVIGHVSHLRPPPRVRRTLGRAEVGTPAGRGETEARRRLGLTAEVTVAAPNRLFIRGRGLDAELGGELAVRGPLTRPNPVGQFELIRGRINILGQRIEFTEGTLTLDGNLDPVVDFRAATQSGEYTAYVDVTGRASDPQITFSSIPELPQDEVLSRILFNRAAEDLSPLQLAQLAAAAAELAGLGGGPGVISQLRESTGLDNLDLRTSEDGATEIEAGKYIDDKTYIRAQTDSEGVSRVGVVRDITDTLKARGSLGTDGDSTFGLFYERDF